VIIINKEEERGCKEIELWGNKVTLYWKESKDKKKNMVGIWTITSR